MNQKQVLDEAYRLHLHHHVIHELNGLVDYRTGELLDALHYQTYPHVPDDQPLLPLFTAVHSCAGLGRYLDHIDKRRLILRNDCRRLFDTDKGRHYLQGSRIHLSKSAYTLLSALVVRLDYRNVIMRTTPALAASLRISTAHLHRTLAKLGPLVRIYTTRHGMAKEVICIAINPAYGFRYESSDFALARHTAIQAWYDNLLQ